MTRIERVKKVCRWLIYTEIASNESDLAKIAGYTKSSFSQIINEKVTLSEKFIEKICLLDENINKVWVLSGDGKMINQTDKKSVVKEPESDYKLNKKRQNLIPLIPIEAIAGYGSGEVQINEGDIIDGYLIPDFDEKGVKYLIRVSGSSMYPKYSNGDLLGCKPIKDLSFFQWGKCYVLDTDQGPIVKRLFEVEGEPDLLLCKSENEERYPPFKIHRKSIYRTAIIVGVLRLE